MWTWALFAAAILVFVFAIRLLFEGRRHEDGSTRRRSLGFGFGFVALVIWTFAFAEILDGWIDAFRLSFGLVLLLPVVEAVARPQGASVFRAALCLLIGVFLAGPIATGLWEDLNPPAAEATVKDAEDHIAELNAQKTKLENYVTQLEIDLRKLRADVHGSGHEDFDAMAEDPAAFKLLKELAELAELRKRALARSEAVSQRLEQVESDVRRLKRHVIAEETLGGAELTEDEIEAIRMKLKTDDLLGEIDVIEQFAEQEELRELFESEFGAGGSKG